MSKHDLKSFKFQVNTILSKLGFITVKNPLRYGGAYDLSDPLSLITRGELDIATSGSVLKPWVEGEPTGLNEYRSHIIDGTEYLFRSEIVNNITEPTLNGTGETAWHYTGVDGAPNEWNNVISYATDIYVWRNLGGSGYHVYKSLVNANLGNTPETSPGEWEHIGPYKFPYDSGETYDLGDFVVDTNAPFKNYISQVEANTFPFDYVVPGTATWSVIGAKNTGGSSGTPTSGTLEASDDPLIITWDTDPVPGDADGRTYLQKHGALEFTTVQLSMPNPAIIGTNTYFPANAWYDEDTKNILTIDNQGQKLYYVIGFGADGNSGGGGGGSMTGAEIRAALGITTLSGSNTGDNANNTASNAYADAKVENNLTASTTVAPSKSAVNSALSDKEDLLPTGLASEYFRGNKTLALLDKIAVGLSQVDNTSDANKPVSTAQLAAIGARIATTEKGAANGVVPLNSSSLIDSVYLPSYVDDVLEYANLATFPGTGETGKIYIALDTNAQYRWSGSTYIELVASPGTTDNVPEGSTNKYWTLARTVGALLTGFVAGTTHVAVAATDTIMQALQKLSGSVASILTDIGLKAPLASPALTGTPTAPTASGGTNTTQIATTAFVQTAVSDKISNATDSFGSKVNNIVSCTQAEYDGLTPDANTFYIII